MNIAMSEDTTSLPRYVGQGKYVDTVAYVRRRDEKCHLLATNRTILVETTVFMENLYVIRCTNYLYWGMLERTWLVLEPRPL